MLIRYQLVKQTELSDKTLESQLNGIIDIAKEKNEQNNKIIIWIIEENTRQKIIFLKIIYIQTNLAINKLI